MKTTYIYDHYAKYAELQKDLESLVSEYPELMELRVNTVTAEGRNQYAVTLTNRKTGDPLSKPALYIDGNIHAGEVTSSMCALCTIDVLLTNYGTDPLVTKLLDEETVYVIPRVSPDGAETYLSTPYNLRSLNQPYQSEKGGLKPEDLDGDGVIRMMRVKTPYGAWKKDPKNEGNMIQRSPSDVTGDFYDIWPESLLEEYAGSENLKQKKPDWGLDMNRNFPLGWFPDARQPGAGKYPLSAKETKAVVDFALAHPNIGGAAIGHTSGGILLYPPGTKPSKDAPSPDMEILRTIAGMGKEELGYTPLNVFDSYMTDQEHYDSGALDDWFYQSQGIPAYTVEFWDVASRAGVPYKWGVKETDEKAESLKRFAAIVQWVKNNAPQSWCDWKEYDHPYFGKVEIGGFDTKFTIQNPPADMLAETCMQDALFNIRYALALPHVCIDSLEAEKVTEGIYEVTALIGNHGYLSTNLTEEAKNLKLNRPVQAVLDGAETVGMPKEKSLGDLQGFSATQTGAIYGNLTTFQAAQAKKKAVWIIRAKTGTEITLSVHSQKGGSVSDKVILP